VYPPTVVLKSDEHRFQRPGEYPINNVVKITTSPTAELVVNYAQQTSKKPEIIHSKNSSANSTPMKLSKREEYVRSGTRGNFLQKII